MIRYMLDAESAEPATDHLAVQREGRVVFTARAFRMFGMFVIPVLLFGAKIWWQDQRSDGSLPIWDWIFLIPLTALAIVGLTIVLLPARLVLDDDGMVWSIAGLRWRYRWEDLESAGETRPYQMMNSYGQNQASGGGDIGINYLTGKGPNKDPVTIAYRRGFNGWDTSISNQFGLSTRRIVEMINQRIAAKQARGRPVIAEIPPVDLPQAELSHLEL